MAKADWLKTSPSSGSGNAEVSVSSTSEHTGRLARQSVLTFKAANVADVTRNVIQAGKPEFVDIEDAMAVEKAGKTVTISGESNSKKLTFSLGTGDLDISLPPSYLANSLSTNNGVDIAGDPGAASVYPFSIQIVVPSNETTSPQSRQLIVTNEAGKTDVCTITLASGDAYLTVTVGDINLDYQGTPVTVNVESNTTWTIE